MPVAGMKMRDKALACADDTGLYESGMLYFTVSAKNSAEGLNTAARAVNLHSIFSPVAVQRDGRNGGQRAIRLGACCQNIIN